MLPSSWVTACTILQPFHVASLASCHLSKTVALSHVCMYVHHAPDFVRCLLAGEKLRAVGWTCFFETNLRSLSPSSTTLVFRRHGIEAWPSLTMKHSMFASSCTCVIPTKKNTQMQPSLPSCGIWTLDWRTKSWPLQETVRSAGSICFLGACERESCVMLW